MKKSISYQEYLIKSLQDPEEAAGYLNAALEGGDIEVFLTALRNVIEAQGGIKKLSKNIHKGHTTLYRILSEKNNANLENTNEILHAMGMHFAVVPHAKSSHCGAKDMK